MTISFPPFNPGSYNVPEDLLFINNVPQTSLPKAEGDMLGVASSAIDPDFGASTGDQLSLWGHLLDNYWSEVFDKTFLKGKREARIGSSSSEITKKEEALEEIRHVFKKLTDDFLDYGDGHIKNNFGSKVAMDFFKNSASGTPLISIHERLKIWESYLRSTEIGHKRYNILLWTWEFLIQIMKTLQLSSINKAVAQRWMNEAQIKGVNEMAKVTYQKQNDATDFGAQHHNQNANHKLDLIRGERSGVQRRSSEKSSDFSGLMSSSQDMNTFLTSLVDQLQSALRGIIR